MPDVSMDTEANATVYKTLLESTKAIPWKIDWSTMRFAYIGPQIESLLGWSPKSWVSVQDWADRMHPDDRERVVNFCVAQSQAGVDHEADYRALTTDGHYVWIRDVVHVVRKENGEVDALIGFMFDISERKQNEEKLAQLQKELEALSFKDGLTGVANRRMFDTVLETEWAHAQRNQQALSLLILDVDHFKQYNDCYGHLRGDECLQRVARILAASLQRPRDFLARFGGEEFVIVLPETDAIAAQTVAERCLDLVTSAQIPHAESATSPVLTISIGVGTIVPGQDDVPRRFIDQVDNRLYQAKRNGRHCIA
ncbi:sensor domain-containing diguanylate cyclase [Noviherbaspirillum sedimenti]|uniref:diguanylate cyclase n=2 Tax=Noviherbaspirillum sedimenti TaxID=2320865 RepID=A0A3A3G1A4_9BURK|nr:sensor domain-containing diguanylate cyclase [Noviherbaspirillum sedimenti]